MTIRTTPDDILPTYQREALAFQATRNKSLFEKSSLDRMLGIAPRNQSPRRLLDLGCGPGALIATYLSERGLDITGVDGAQSMVDLFARTLPNAQVIHANMRTLDLGRNFDAILAWNMLFPSQPRFLTCHVSRLRSPRGPKCRADVYIRHIAGRGMGPYRDRRSLPRKP
ncbi:class I SAM-dependent methyltransferase [Octadecabacter sp.]|nr:class I SAM-dependent methyltransferase [Octadecabacter sp.]